MYQSLALSQMHFSCVKRVAKPATATRVWVAIKKIMAAQPQRVFHTFAETHISSTPRYVQGLLSLFSERMLM